MGRPREVKQRLMSSKIEAGAKVGSGGNSTNGHNWQVYILECGDGSLYTGITRNLKARLITHNKGIGAKYTRGRLPVRLIYAEPALDRAIATQREMAIKKLSRPHKLNLINSFKPSGKPSAS